MYWTYVTVIVFLCHNILSIFRYSDQVSHKIPNCTCHPNSLVISQEKQNPDLVIKLSMLLEHSICSVSFFHAWIQCGDRGPPPPLDKSQKYRVLKHYWSGSSVKSQVTKPVTFNVGPLSARQRFAGWLMMARL